MTIDRKPLAVLAALLAVVALAGCATWAPTQSTSKDVTDRLAKDSQGR